MFRKGLYDIEFVFGLVKAPEERVLVDGDIMNTKSLRMRTFAYKGIHCVNCERYGRGFVKEKHHASDQTYHFALYHWYNDDREPMILMTKDHILPISKGGRDFLGNMQPMCAVCNFTKAGDPLPVGVKFTPNELFLRIPLSSPTMTS